MSKNLEIFKKMLNLMKEFDTGNCGRSHEIPDSIEVGADTDRWYNITYNPYMNNGEYEIYDHEGDHEKYMAFKRMDSVISYVTGDDIDGIASTVEEIMIEMYGGTPDADIVIDMTANVRDIITEDDDVIAVITKVLEDRDR